MPTKTAQANNFHIVIFCYLYQPIETSRYLVIHASIENSEILKKIEYSKYVAQPIQSFKKD